jgi:hypothetical protein
MPKVSIDTPPLTVTIEASDASLDEVRRHALEIYREVYDRGMRTNPIAAGVGFTTERDDR